MPSIGRNFRPARDPKRNALEPGSQQFMFANRAGLECQDQKRGLKGILGRLLIIQDATADPQDHRTMPVQDSLESPLRDRAASGHEVFQQLPIAKAAERSHLIKGVEVMNERLRWFTYHHRIPTTTDHGSFYDISPWGGPLEYRFCPKSF